MTAFFVAGIPVPQGSKTKTRWGGIREANANLPAWRQDVVQAAREAHGGRLILLGPLSVDLRFRFIRPASHYGTGRNAGKLKPSAPWWKTSKPDADKLARAILDALTVACVWKDDAQVVYLLAAKVYAYPDEQPGCTVEVKEII